MPKVLTDRKLIDKFLDRGVDSIFPKQSALRNKLMKGDRITAYMGFDPTGPYLHVGHAMGIRAMRILQQLGHRVIFLVGDYTARVGDPDKDKVRKLLTAEEIEKNMAGWQEQASQLIDFEDKENPVEFLHNYDWLAKIDLEKIIELMSTMSVQQMLERDMFAKRMQEEKPIYLQEFIYPLMQGYDSVAMEVDLELGGTDQIFNMLVGRDLVKQYLNKEKFVRAHEMMPAPEGLTMSKTKGNGINLSDSPEDMYGIAMSYPDEHIVTGLRLLTDTEEEELEEISNAIKKGDNPMHYKKLMAYRIVETIKGKQAAQRGEEHFENTVQKDEVSEQRTIISLQKLNEKLSKSGKTNDTIEIISELSGNSRSQAKQLLKQNGIELNQKKLSKSDTEIALKAGDIIKIGKRNWFEFVER
jgi:tyrosyl-tRNA synthetase